MKLTKLPWTLGLTSGLLVLGCSGVQGTRASLSSESHPGGPGRALANDDDDDGDDEVDVALSDVPDAVKQAALAAVPGLVLTGAERETENGVIVYSLEGTANGKNYEVEVSAAGQVLETEQGDDDEEEGDD
jgi:hypothetical protein